MNEDEITKEIVESVQAHAEPIDFGKLIEIGLLIKKGRSYYAPDIQKLPENVSRRLKTAIPTKDGIRVTFHKEPKSLKELADQRKQVSSKIENVMIKVSWLAFALGFTAAGLTVVGQLIAWLKTGEKHSLPFSSAFTFFGFDPYTPVDSISWIGVRQILLQILGLPLSVGFLITGIAVGSVFLMCVPKNK